LHCRLQLTRSHILTGPRADPILKICPVVHRRLALQLPRRLTSQVTTPPTTQALTRVAAIPVTVLPRRRIEFLQSPSCYAVFAVGFQVRGCFHPAVSSIQRLGKSVRVLRFQFAWPKLLCRSETCVHRECCWFIHIGHVKCTVLCILDVQILELCLYCD
jgi:hypothetical protein